MVLKGNGTEGCRAAGLSCHRCSLWNDTQNLWWDFLLPVDATYSNILFWWHLFGCCRETLLQLGTWNPHLDNNRWSISPYFKFAKEADTTLYLHDIFWNGVSGGFLWQEMFWQGSAMSNNLTQTASKGSVLMENLACHDTQRKSHGVFFTPCYKWASQDLWQETVISGFITSACERNFLLSFISICERKCWSTWILHFYRNRIDQQKILTPKGLSQLSFLYHIFRWQKIFLHYSFKISTYHFKTQSKTKMSTCVYVFVMFSLLQ